MKRRLDRLASSHGGVHAGFALPGVTATAIGKKRTPDDRSQVRAVLKHLLDLRKWDEKEILAWSDWRQNVTGEPSSVTNVAAKPNGGDIVEKSKRRYSIRRLP